MHFPSNWFNFVGGIPAAISSSPKFICRQNYFISSSAKVPRLKRILQFLAYNSFVERAFHFKMWFKISYYVYTNCNGNRSYVHIMYIVCTVSWSSFSPQNRQLCFLFISPFSPDVAYVCWRYVGRRLEANQCSGSTLEHLVSLLPTSDQVHPALIPQISPHPALCISAL